jgi:TfoX/Sxy family transcriptional regulator of competence genes
MPYDEDLAHRIRELVAGEPDVTEQRMFGGLAFLVSGNMSVAASGQGGLMVRIDPEDADALLAKPHARPFEMRGREMQGWLRVDPEGLRTKRQLAPWVTRGVAYARSLPAKAVGPSEGRHPRGGHQRRPPQSREGERGARRAAVLLLVQIRRAGGRARPLFLAEAVTRVSAAALA